MKKLLTIAALLSFVVGSQMFGSYTPEKNFNVKKFYKTIEPGGTTVQRIQKTESAAFNWLSETYDPRDQEKEYYRAKKKINDGIDRLFKKYAPNYAP